MDNIEFKSKELIGNYTRKHVKAHVGFEIHNDCDLNIGIMFSGFYIL